MCCVCTALRENVNITIHNAAAFKHFCVSCLFFFFCFCTAFLFFLLLFRGFLFFLCVVQQTAFWYNILTVSDFVRATTLTCLLARLLIATTFVRFLTRCRPVTYRQRLLYECILAYIFQLMLKASTYLTHFTWLPVVLLLMLSSQLFNSSEIEFFLLFIFFFFF